MENLVFILIGTLCLVAGLTVYFINIKRENDHFHTTLIIGWLLIALFPVFIIFPFFPESQAEGQIFNFSFSGAVAVFIITWWFGIKKATSGSKLDSLKKENKYLKEKLELEKHNISNIMPSNQEKVIGKTEKHVFTLKERKDKKVGLITGSITEIKGIEVWVNSENTNMQMARFYEDSISGIIRYMGAGKDKFGNVKEDFIAKFLKKEVEDNLYIQPTTVLITDSGELAHTHGVKKIFHVAAVHGEVGAGYKTVSNVQQCVNRSLEAMDNLDDPLKTIIFPLFGTGMGGGDVKEITANLIETVILYFKSNKNTKIREIYFLAYTDIQLNRCLKVLKSSPMVH